MYRYVIKRIFMMIPIVIGVSFIIFSILAFIPGDPGSIILGPGATQAEVNELNHQLGYDQPFLQRYANYMYKAFVSRDFGISYATRLPVFQQIMQRLPVSFLLAASAMLLAIVVGVPIGMLSAVRQYTALDYVPTAIALFLASLPAFLIGMVLMLFFSLWLNWFPSNGIGSWEHYVMPTISLGLPYASFQLRFTRSSMLETIRQDYIRTAKAKGAPESSVIWHHAMRNALLPVVTVAGNNFGLLIGGAVATETLFGMPGLGTLIVNGINTRDLPIVMAGIIVFTILFSLIILLVDVMYAFIDPRVKARYTSGD
ncbi:MAG: ABC transporter permease [Synergistota bacterium]|nr:ABC transporter permease [Synergistota bacterium]